MQPRLTDFHRLAVPAALIAAGLAFGAGGTRADDDDKRRPRIDVSIHKGTLEIVGTSSDDALALRLKEGKPEKLEIDAGDDGKADCGIPATAPTSSRARPARTSWTSTAPARARRSTRRRTASASASSATSATSRWTSTASSGSTPPRWAAPTRTTPATSPAPTSPSSTPTSPARSAPPPPTARPTL
jgi:hypothetical protein